MPLLVETPRVNANEDQLQVIGVHVSSGQAVVADQLLFVLETTKTAVEVLAPQAGTIRKIFGRIGDFVAVGTPLCELMRAEGARSIPNSVGPLVAPEDIVITAKARKVAGELGIALAEVAAVDGRIGEAEVRAAVTAAAPGRASANRWKDLAPATRRAVIVGGGGHGACLVDALHGAGFDVLGCVDQALAIGTPVAAGIGVIGDESLLPGLYADGVRYAFVGVGGAEDSRTRRLVFEHLLALGFEIPPVIHASASVAGDARIGRGCHVLADATIGPRCVIGENVIVNQGSIVCHDSVIHDHVHLTPGAMLAGSIIVGPRSVVGMGATVLLGTTIGADCLIHNGSHVVSDVPDGSVVDARGRRTRRLAVAQVLGWIWAAVGWLGSGIPVLV